MQRDLRRVSAPPILQGGGQSGRVVQRGRPSTRRGTGRGGPIAPQPGRQVDVSPPATRRQTRSVTRARGGPEFDEEDLQGAGNERPIRVNQRQNRRNRGNVDGTDEVGQNQDQVDLRHPEHRVHGGHPFRVMMPAFAGPLDWMLNFQQRIHQEAVYRHGHAVDLFVDDWDQEQGGAVEEFFQQRHYMPPHPQGFLAIDHQQQQQQQQQQEPRPMPPPQQNQENIIAGQGPVVNLQEPPPMLPPQENQQNVIAGQGPVVNLQEPPQNEANVIQGLAANQEEQLPPQQQQQPGPLAGQQARQPTLPPQLVLQNGANQQQQQFAQPGALAQNNQDNVHQQQQQQDALVGQHNLVPVVQYDQVQQAQPPQQQQQQQYAQPDALAHNDVGFVPQQQQQQFAQPAALGHRGLGLVAQQRQHLQQPTPSLQLAQPNGLAGYQPPPPPEHNQQSVFARQGLTGDHPYHLPRRQATHTPHSFVPNGQQWQQSPAQLYSLMGENPRSNSSTYQDTAYPSVLQHQSQPPQMPPPLHSHSSAFAQNQYDNSYTNNTHTSSENPNAQQQQQQQNKNLAQSKNGQVGAGGVRAGRGGKFMKGKKFFSKPSDNKKLQNIVQKTVKQQVAKVLGVNQQPPLPYWNPMPPAPYPYGPSFAPTHFPSMPAPPPLNPNYAAYYNYQPR